MIEKPRITRSRRWSENESKKRKSQMRAPPENRAVLPNTTVGKEKKEIIEGVGFSAQSTTFLALRFAMLWFAASGGRVDSLAGSFILA